MASYDQFGRVIRSAPAPQLDIPIRESYSSYNSYRSSSYSSRAPWYRRLWEGFDDAITSIGNFIARNGEPFANITVGIGVWVMAIGLVWWVISHWISDGFLWAILYAFGALILFGIGSFCIGIISYVLQLVIAGLRLLFWGAWSFLCVLIVVVGFICYSNYNNRSSDSSSGAETEMVAYPTYSCTAKVLNIRSAPNTYSSVLGVLRKGEQVEVLETESGFAKISHNGRTGYVSMDYLQPRE